MNKYPAGTDVIAQGKCPRGMTIVMACMFCTEGHMTECHAGKTCQEAQCHHWLAKETIDENDPDAQEYADQVHQGRCD